MTVGELIEQLRSCPSDTRVITLGYKAGYNDISMDVDDIVLDVRDNGPYGTHDLAGFFVGRNSEKCVIIRRV